jgi:hypothetical protein
VSTNDPADAWSDARISYEIHWPEAVVGSRAHQRLWSDRSAYHLELELETTEDGASRSTRRWHRSFPRDHQ